MERRDLTRAAREKKFVIMSLQSWWCRWCHVMNRETWANAEVRSLLKDNFIPVYVDQDSRPDISQRYERWGWPATIIFGPDGTEIVKLRGFYSPQFFMPVLTETVKDPSPVDYPRPRRHRARTHAGDRAKRHAAGGNPRLHRQRLGRGARRLEQVEIRRRATLIWSLQRARQGDTVNTARIKRILSLMAATMIDKSTGGMSQVNLKPDWSEPCAGISDVRAGGGLPPMRGPGPVRRSRLSAGRGDRIYGFLKDTLAAPGGGFYASLGMSEGEPGVDRRLYARETAQAIQGLLAYYDATGDKEARRSRSRRRLGAGQPRLARRRLPPCGAGQGGPYLADNVEMGESAAGPAPLDRRARMACAGTATADFIARTFIDPATGGFVASARPTPSN